MRLSFFLFIYFCFPNCMLWNWNEAISLQGSINQFLHESGSDSVSEPSTGLDVVNKSVAHKNLLLQEIKSVLKQMR